MLPLTDICEEEEDEEEDDDDKNDSEEDNNERKRLDGYSLDVGKNGGCNEITCLLIGHGSTSLYPVDICDDDIDMATHHPSYSRHRECGGSGSGGGGIDGNDGIGSGNVCHRPALGELHANGASPWKKSIPINTSTTTNNNNTNQYNKLHGYTLISNRAVCKPLHHHKKDKRKTDPLKLLQHSSPPTSLAPLSSSPPSSSSSPPADAKNIHQLKIFDIRTGSDLPPSPTSSSSPSSSSPCQTTDACKALAEGRTCLDIDVVDVKEEVLTEHPREKVSRSSPEKQTRFQQLTHNCDVDMMTTMEEVKADVRVKVMVPTTLPGHYASSKNRGLPCSEAWPSSTVAATTTITPTPSDSLSPSSSSCLSVNQNDKADDVILPNYRKHHQTLIPIHEVKRGLTRKQMFQLSAMSGIGFVFVGFIILWIMSPVLF